MNIQCNVCAIQIDENEVESHINTSQHIENRSKISTNGKGLDESVANMWSNSLAL